MDLGLLLLYTIASLLALRALFALMMHHRQAHMGRLLAEEAERRKREKVLESQTAQNSSQATEPEREKVAETVSGPARGEPRSQSPARNRRAAG
jgi:hypothetical protein